MKKNANGWGALLLSGSLAIGLTACTTTSVELPALSESNTKLTGQVIWRDLVTHKPAEAQNFYENVFGWHFDQYSDDYATITYQGDLIGGMATLPSSNVSSYWLPVVSTDNLDSSLAKAEGAGGKVLISSTELSGRGHIGVVRDPQGAVFSLIDTVSGDPEKLPKLSGSWMWQEVWTDSVESSLVFYEKIANYKALQRSVKGNHYLYVTVDDAPAFGIVKKPNSEVASTWVNYIKVDDVDATLEKVNAFGGDVLMAPTEEVRGGSVAIVRDPSGAGFVIQEVE
ncbi:VOC family protein [Psychromonas aquatilis]|uniref:VOC family protein n=1 Tax=Psychromonas aquatilis TaxID=2005072 RepID=A0ABU9GPN1_9GAMM